jgi:DNA-binding protein Fis
MSPEQTNERVVMPLAQVERRTILRAMIVTENNKEKAARLLGIGKTTLKRKLARYDYPQCLLACAREV